jgi:hypothetical protein
VIIVPCVRMTSSSLVIRLGLRHQVLCHAAMVQTRFRSVVSLPSRGKACKKPYHICDEHRGEVECHDRGDGPHGRKLTPASESKQSKEYGSDLQLLCLGTISAVLFFGAARRLTAAFTIASSLSPLPIPGLSKSSRMGRNENTAGVQMGDVTAGQESI